MSLLLQNVSLTA